MRRHGWLALGLLSAAACGLDVASRRAADHSTAGRGDASHTENKPATDIHAGGDAEVSNWSFTATGGGWAVAGLAGLGWLVSARGRAKETKAVDDVVTAIEDTNCEACKARVQARRNRHVNKRVAQLTRKEI